GKLVSKNGYYVLEWLTCSWKEDGYCNRGNLPGAYIVGKTLRYQDLEWYKALKDGKLKEEALKNKAIMEGIIEDDDDEPNNKGWRRWNVCEWAVEWFRTNGYEQEIKVSRLVEVVGEVIRSQMGLFGSAGGGQKSSDPSLITLIANLQAGKPCSKHYSWSNQQLTRKGKLVMGDDPALRFSLLNHFLGDSTGGHFGIATTQRIQAFCYWRKMKKQVKEFVSMCTMCQRGKPDLSAYPGLPQPLPIPTLLWSKISMDFVEGLSNSGGKTVIMVVVDRLSKYSYFMALSHPFTAIQDGQTKVVNRYLECYLRCMTGEKPKEWANWLSLAEYWYNTNFYTSINTTPFEAVYCQPPTSPILYSQGQSKIDSVYRSLAARNMIKENNKLVVYVLIQWSNGSPNDATWELATTLEKKFPDFLFNS
nr:hypothetical protein [Tanacetum cinerariifolium]